MGFLHRTFIFALAVLMTVPVRADLSVRKSGRVASPPPVVVQTPKKKEKKRRDPASLIKSAVLRWVDIGKTGNGKGIDGEGDGSGSGSNDLSNLGNKLFGGKGNGGTGGGAGSKTASGNGSNTFFDENAKKNGEKVDPGPRGGGDKGAAKGLGGGPPDGSKVPSLWIPICFFFDTAHPPEEMNSIVKTVVDNFGKCDVAVRPYPFMIRPGTYQKDDPNSMNQYAQGKCNANQAFGVEGSAAQTHPDSIIASDIMCKPNWNLQRDGTNTGGCSGLGNRGGGSFDSSLTAGNGYGALGASGVPQTSIVDMGSASASTHELGHSVGGPGAGGSYLVNEGDGVGTPRPPSAGEALQLMSNSTASIPIDRSIMFAEPGGGGLGGGFNDAGCRSIRGGANPNTRQIRYNPNQQFYYKGVSPAGWINFNDGKPIFGTRVPGTPGNGQPPPPLANRGGGSPGEPQYRSPGARNQSVPQGEAPRSGPPSVQHPNKNSFAGAASNSAAQTQTNNILANSTRSIPQSIPQLPEPKLKDPSMLVEPVVPLPPGAKDFGGGGFSTSITFDENAKKGGGGSGSSLVGSSGGAASGSSSSIYFDEGAPKGGGQSVSIGGTTGETPVSLGRVAAPPIVVSGRAPERIPASEEEKQKKKEKKKKEKRKFGDGLRNRTPAPTEVLYQTGGTGSYDD